MYVCMCVCVCMHVYMKKYIYIYLYICMCMYVCMYIYVCMCICIYVYMYICIYIYKLSLISVLCDGSSAVLSQGSETLQLSRAFKGCSRPIYNFLSSSRVYRDDFTFFFSFRKCFVA